PDLDGRRSRRPHRLIPYGIAYSLTALPQEGQCPSRLSQSHSQSAFFRFRLLAFSETARFTWSVAPLGNSADISTVTFTWAFGSEANTEIISSASCTRRSL